MCGIAGILLDKGRDIDPRRLARMAEIQAHRGPDHKSWTVVGNAGFAYSRLSILDLSEAAHQPFTNERYVLYYNGEIYNYRELKAHLEKKANVVFRSNSDTEVLFQSLVHDGVEKTLQSCRGMFAFLFYDKKENSIVLARDRFGIKPLAYLETDGGLVWASEIKAIAEAVPRLELDPVLALLSVAGRSESSPTSTVFRGVRQVPPGCYLSCRAGEALQIHRYFSPTDLIDREYSRELERSPWGVIAERFQELLAGSVEGMLMSDVPVGAFVSGGLDSSLIAALARRKADALQLFTAHVVGRYSEYSQAKALSAHLRSPLRSYEFQPDHMLRDWASVTYHYEAPLIAFPNAIPFSNTARLTRRYGVKPVLTGEGADELFSGYPFLYYRRVREALRRMTRFLERLASLVPGVRQALPHLREEAGRELANILHMAIQDGTGDGNAGSDAGALAWMSHKERKFRKETLAMLVGYPLVGLLHRNDRMGMMASIESRFPFLDEEVVRFALNLPERWKRRKTWRIHDWRHPFQIDKFAVRKAVEAVYDPSASRQPKWDFKMYDLRHLHVDPDYFDGGYVEGLLGLSAASIRRLCEREAGDTAARLVSLDIFGRLFALRDPVDSITSRLTRHVRVVTDGR